MEKLSKEAPKQNESLKVKGFHLEHSDDNTFVDFKDGAVSGSKSKIHKLDKMNLTTVALNEEGGSVATTKALGEEGGCSVTYAIGENGDDSVSYSLGENGGVLQLDLDKLKKLLNNRKILSKLLDKLKQEQEGKPIKLNDITMQQEQDSFIEQITDETIRELQDSMSTTKSMNEEGGTADLREQFMEYIRNYNPELE